MDKELKGQGLSRRSFLSGAAIAGASAAAFGLSACGAQPETKPTDNADTKPATETAKGNSNQTANTQNGGGKPSFFTAPEAIPEKDIKETKETDVLVIGAGYSGLAAALSSQENGLNVIIAEKTKQINGRGAGTGVVNSKFAQSMGATVDDIPAAVFRWNQTCGNRTNESLVDLFMTKSGEAMDWLLEHSEKYGVEIDLWDGYSRNPLLPDEPGYHMINFAQNGKGVADFDVSKFPTTEILGKEVQEAGVEILYESPAVQLVKDGDAIVGAILKTAEGYTKVTAKKGVVLATGDIAGDEEMVDYYCPQAKNAAPIYSPVGANTGDGHKMGLWVGAAMQDRMFPPMLHPQRYCDKASNQMQGPFMFVNEKGKRFFNEGTWVQAKSLQIMNNTKDAVAYVVYDQNWPEELLDSLPHGGGMFWDSFRFKGKSDYASTVEYYKKSVEETIETKITVKADTLEELAEGIGVPVDEFLKTVKRYNELCAKGIDEDFNKNPQFMYPIDKPPYYASKVGACLLAIVGGLKVDTNLQCMNEAGEPIQGLYAVGNVSGDAYAIDYPINVPGNSHGRCLTWGYWVGKVLSGQTN